MSSPAVNVSLVLLGRELTDTSIKLIYNATNATAVEISDIGAILSTKTINGVRTVVLTLNDTASTYAAQGQTLNVSYNYEPDGYLERAVDRNIVGLITLFGALATMVFVFVVFIQFGSLGNLMNSIRRKQ